MVRRIGSYAIPALLVAGLFMAPVRGVSQVTFPGQYPPGTGPYPPGTGPYPGGTGRYPGGSGPYPGGTGPYPGGTRTPGQRRSTTTTTKEEQARTSTITGMLRRISKTDLVVQSEDKRIVTVSLANNTKYQKNSGDGAKQGDFGPGDHISIDATQDDNGYYHAKTVTLVKQGNAEEQIAASEPVDTSPLGDSGPGNASKPRGNDSRGVDDDGPPRLRRAPAENPDNSATAQTEPQSGRTVRPQITDGDSDAAPPSRAARTEPDTPIPPDPDDSGPPKLRRGTPRPSDSEPPRMARNSDPGQRPTIHADDVNGVTKRPDAPKLDNRPALAAGADHAPIRATGDSVIDNARRAAFEFSETLPNYVVKQFTTRFQTEAAHGSQTSWRALDNVTADVVSENGKETYKNLLVNGKPPKEAIEKTGSWSTGEFSSVLLDVLSPETDANFHNKRSTTIANHAAFRYDFSVDQENSHWHVYSAADSYRPAYTGAIWIDKETSRVLRIEMSAQSMPKAFPLDTVESAVDYDYVTIGDGKFLLPVHSEALDCERGSRICSRNVIDFRNYRKFGADTSITFESSDK